MQSSAVLCGHLVGLSPGLIELLKTVRICVWSNSHQSCGLLCTTMSGGSLGSCVDEERSQLCELM